jgi:hypothetical protein
MKLSARTQKQVHGGVSMSRKTFGLLLGAAMCATPLMASAKSINRIEHREQVRINRGIRSGELTRAEAKRLEAEQARIRVNERFSRSDGLTAKERERLQKQLRHASHDIYRQKHDNQDRN